MIVPCSNALLSFVFAHEEDVYFESDLQKLSLKQYLWKKLHDEKYERVYFLEQDGRSFRSKTVKGKDISLPGNGLFGGLKSLEKRMLKHLKSRNEKTAFVCPLKDFCEVMGTKVHEKTLIEWSEILNPTGLIVLTAPPTVDASRDYLLYSPVFEVLQETAVTNRRKGTPECLYEALKQDKMDHCLFLNAITPERIKNMLQRVMLEHIDRCRSPQELTQLSEFLSQYLLNQTVQWEYPIFDKLQGYFRYKDIYGALQEEETWNKLLEVAETLQFCCEGPGISNYQAPIEYSPNSTLAECMKLRLPKWIERSNNREWKASGYMYLSEIQKALRAPKNTCENQEIVAEIATAYQRINDLNVGYEQHHHDGTCTGDTDTFMVLAQEMAVLVKRIYESDEETAVLAVQFAKYMVNGAIYTRSIYQCSGTIKQLEALPSRDVAQESCLATCREDLTRYQNQGKHFQDHYGQCVARLNHEHLASEAKAVVKALLQQFEKTVVADATTEATQKTLQNGRVTFDMEYYYHGLFDTDN